MLLIFKLAIVALTFGVSSCNSYNESIFMLSWSDVNLDSVRFEFTTKTDLTDKVWSAFAFSYDDKMVISLLPELLYLYYKAQI